MATRRKPMLVFDGDCGFCTRAARWAEAGWGQRADSVPWQRLGVDGLAEVGLDPAMADRAAWWVDTDGQLSEGHRAMAKAVAAGGGWRHLVGAAATLPGVSMLSAALYSVIASNRHRLPGGTPSCRAD